jgi:glutaminyl-peptide cyclotransferase
MMKPVELSCFPVKVLILFQVLFLCVNFSCNSRHNAPMKDAGAKLPSERVFQLKEPQADQLFSLNDSIRFELSGKKLSGIDSICIHTDGEVAHVEKEQPASFKKSGLFRKVGQQSFRLQVFYDDSLSQTISRQIIILSDMLPAQLSYRVINKLPHNPENYIQGLFYYKGYLYEGTGKEKRSRLIKTEPGSGNVIMERNLEDKFFGEGITRVGDKIYQLTYKQKIGFIYDLITFEKLQEFDLQTMEGWGLAFDEKNLILSEGSNRLFLYHPENFTQTGQLDVANDKGMVNNLNELEFCNGYIWANIYGKPVIIKIDPLSGKVLAELNLESLFPEEIERDYDHVLNGIAYNPDHNTFFVTGKFWPVMYEIKIQE